MLRLGSARTGVEKIRRKRRKIKNDPTKKNWNFLMEGQKMGLKKRKGAIEKKKRVCVIVSVEERERERERERGRERCQILEGTLKHLHPSIHSFAPFTLLFIIQSNLQQFSFAPKGIIVSNLRGVLSFGGITNTAIYSYINILYNILCAS